MILKYKSSWDKFQEDSEIRREFNDFIAEVNQQILSVKKCNQMAEYEISVKEMKAKHSFKIIHNLKEEYLQKLKAFKELFKSLIETS